MIEDKSKKLLQGVRCEFEYKQNILKERGDPHTSAFVDKFELFPLLKRIFHNHIINNIELSEVKKYLVAHNNGARPKEVALTFCMLTYDEVTQLDLFLENNRMSSESVIKFINKKLKKTGL